MIVTADCGPSKAAFLSVSFVELPIRNVPGGTNTIFVGAGNATENLWTPIRTNQFDQFGVFSFTNSVNLGEQQRYFPLLLP